MICRLIMYVTDDKQMEYEEEVKTEKSEGNNGGNIVSLG